MDQALLSSAKQQDKDHWAGTGAEEVPPEQCGKLYCEDD